VKVTAEQLRFIMPTLHEERAALWAPYLSDAMTEFFISTPPRAAAFLAQDAHESRELSALVESMNYSADRMIAVWPSRFGHQSGATAAQRAAGRTLAAKLAHQPAALANYVYGARGGNRGEASGDGWLYIARGPLGTTGRANYGAAGLALGLPLLDHPELLEHPQHGSRAAAYFWQSNGLNKVVDAGESVADRDGALEAFTACSKAVNLGSPTAKGTPLGMAERLAYWQRARKALSA